MRTIHSDVTLEKVLEAIKADDLRGFCIACGWEVWDVEPDPRK
jgi:hypothetical protein